MPQPEVQPLLYKPDWPQATRRWTAFWEGSNDDRPLITVTAPRPHDEPPLPAPASLESLYLDPDYISRAWLRRMKTTWFGGESVPTGGFFMAGYALGCGPGIVFAPNTVWHPVLMNDIRAPLGFAPGPDDPWTRKLEAVIRRLLDLAPGEFVVGHACQVMANDLLALLRGSEDFLIDMARDLDVCVRRLEEIVEPWCAAFDYFRRIIESRQTGCVWGWPGLWHPRLALVSQSDMSCMISSAMFARYVLRELDLIAERYAAPLWYHVDGPNAMRHVPALLSRPYMRIIQYTTGAGNAPNGPPYLDLYRRVQAAGRGLDLDAPWEHAEFLIRRLRPEGVVLRVRAPSIAAGEQLLADAARWCGSHAGRG